jgi:hypothetical protein
MTNVTPDEAAVVARQAVGASAAVKARAWRVVRLDRIGESYFLVVLGDDRAAVAVAAIRADTGETMTLARLEGIRQHFLVDAARALQLANLSNASAELVWQPCQASLSPLYPFWRVSGATRSVFVDQQERCWDRLSAARA